MYTIKGIIRRKCATTDKQGYIIICTRRKCATTDKQGYIIRRKCATTDKQGYHYLH